MVLITFTFLTSSGETTARQNQQLDCDAFEDHPRLQRGEHQDQRGEMCVWGMLHDGKAVKVLGSNPKSHTHTVMRFEYVVGFSQSKGGILSKACDYIGELQEHNQRLQEGLRGFERVQMDHDVLRQQVLYARVLAPLSLICDWLMTV